MKRLFTFGCSHTRFAWPTWANILGQDYSQVENWARIGGGNHFIFYSLLEAIQRKSIQAEDDVVVMWTAAGKEDRYINGDWKTMGSVYYSELDQSYIEKFTDPTGFYLTSATIIHAAKQILDKTGCNYQFLSVVPLHKIDDSHLEKNLQLNNQTVHSINEVYKSSLSEIKPSLYEVIFDNDWHSRDSITIPRIQRYQTRLLQENYELHRGIDWPTFDDFYQDRMINVDREILRELEQQFGYPEWKHRIKTQRQCMHLLPIEAAEYLTAIGYDLSQRQLEYAHRWNDIVLSTAEFDFHDPHPMRF